MDLGQSRRGVDMGPSAIRYAGLQARLEQLGCRVLDMGNVPVPGPEEEAAESGVRRLRAVAHTCENVYQQARETVVNADFGIYLGGDHSMSIGTIAAAAADGQGGRRPIGVVWIDAHGDFNTPQSSPSGNIHGMPLAAVTGSGPDALVNVGFSGMKVEPANIVPIGIRSLDAGERTRLVEAGIRVYTMRHLDEMGMATIARHALDRLRHLDYVHVSLDMDSLEPDAAPGVGTPVPGGLTYREAHLLMEILGDAGCVRSLDIVEVNPILDNGNRTAELAVELAASLLGQRIL